MKRWLVVWLMVAVLAAGCRADFGLEATATSATMSQPTATAAAPTLTPPPAATRPLVVTPTGTPPALQFYADRLNIAPGETLTLHWSTGAVVSGTVAISLRAAHGAQPGLDDWRNLPAQGSLDVPMGLDPRGRYIFSLSASYPTEPPFYTLPFRFPCPDHFFFEFPANWQDLRPLSYDRCPAGPAHMPPALEQAFEHGRMLWLQTDGLILVLHGDGRTPGQANDWSWHTDTWTAAEPEMDPRFAAPAGLWVPRRGFGKVWAENTAVRERLGWALAPEQGFTSADQRDWEVPGTDSPEYRYLRAADGSVLALTDYAGHGLQPNWMVVAP